MQENNDSSLYQQYIYVRTLLICSLVVPIWSWGKDGRVGHFWGNWTRVVWRDTPLNCKEDMKNQKPNFPGTNYSLSHQHLLLLLQEQELKEEEEEKGNWFWSCLIKGRDVPGFRSELYHRKSLSPSYYSRPSNIQLMCAIYK